MGKSTLASATAVRAALDGRRVLAVSGDQAHSLGDVLGAPVPPGGAADPVRILTEERGGEGGGGHLDALALDTLALVATAWRSAAPVLAARAPESDLNDLAPEELSGATRNTGGARSAGRSRPWRPQAGGTTWWWTARPPPMRCGC